jgi:hypothetical protein
MLAQMPRPGDPVKRVLAALRKHGMLLGTDYQLPSVAAAAYDGRAADASSDRPGDREIFAVQAALGRRKDVLVVKLVRAKITYVHRDLWPDLLAVALSGDSWQMGHLPARDVRLLERVDTEGVVRFDQEAYRLAESNGNELEARLLVIGGIYHTHPGPQIRTLTSWAAWAFEHGAAPSDDLVAAYARLDAAANALGPTASLPWWKRPLRKRW